MQLETAQLIARRDAEWNLTRISLGQTPAPGPVSGLTSERALIESWLVGFVFPRKYAIAQ
jgi:hypothetical protein